MNSDFTVLAIEIENLHRRENEMYRFYSDLLKEIGREEIIKKIKFIRDQELGHIAIVTQIIAILKEYIAKG